MFKPSNRAWEKVGKLSFLAGVCLWLLFLITSEISFSDTGMIDTIGILFIFCVILILLAIILHVFLGKIDYICILAVFSLFLALYTLPWLIEGTPYFTATFRVLGYTNLIIENSSYNPSAVDYLNWPGMMLVGSFIKSTFNCQAVEVLYIYPFFSKAVQIFLVYMIIKTLSHDGPGAIAGVTLFLLFDWTPYYMYLPPSMGLILFLGIVLITCAFYNDPERKIGWTGLLIVFVSSIVVSHLMSAILSLAILITLYLLENSPFRLIRIDGKGTVTFGVLALTVVIMTTYTVYGSARYFESTLPGFINSMGDLFRVFSSAGNAGTGTDAYSEVVFFKYLFTFLIGLVLIIAFLFVIKNKKNIKDFRFVYPFVIMFISVIVPIVIFSLYSFEAITRAFAYAIPFVALFLVYSRNRRVAATLIVILLLISPVLFIASAYGNMNKDFISRDEIIGTTFFYDHTDEQKTLVYGFNERLLLMDDIDQWRYRNIKIEQGEGNWINSTFPSCVIISDRATSAALYFGISSKVNETYDILNSGQNARVYDSPTYRIYWGGAWNSSAIYS